MENAYQVVSPLLLDLALAILSLLLAFGTNAAHKLTQKAKAETKKLQSEEQRNLLVNALDDLDNLVTKTVADIEQTTANAMREAVKDGLIDREKLLNLSKQAYCDISAAIAPEAKELIEKQFGNFSNYLTKCIEAKVLEMKSPSSANKA